MILSIKLWLLLSFFSSYPAKAPKLKHFAVHSDLPYDEFAKIIDRAGGSILGKVPFANIYCVDSIENSQFSFWDALEYLGLRRSKRNIEALKSQLISHPSIQAIKPQYVLPVSKRFIKNSRDSLLHITHGTDEPNTKQSNEDEIYATEYVEYVKTMRNLVSFNDPHSQNLWQYLNDGSITGTQPGLDLNVYPAYLCNITGHGSNVVILDDGLDTLHPDLKENYDRTISTNVDNPQKNGYSPRGPLKYMPADDGHGTRCAGLAAAVANNGFCSHGIAYHSKIGAVRMLTGEVTDIVESISLSYEADRVDIYCASWGPTDDGITMDLPQEYTTNAFNFGIKEGRNKLGSLYVFASGNGGLVGDHCGADGFVSSPFTIAVAALTQKGQKTIYSEACSAVRISVPIGNLDLNPDHYILPTTQENGECLPNFEGTSAAAPIAAGCLALGLQTNPKLTWRDVFHILPWSSRLPSADDNQWQINGAGIPHHPYLGHGLLDCYRLTTIAKQWNNVGPLCVKLNSAGSYNKSWGHYQAAIKQANQFPFACDEECRKYFTTNTFQESEAWPINIGEKTVIPIHINDKSGKTHFSEIYNIPNNNLCQIDLVEQVTVHVQWQHICRGSLKFYLISPSGSKSVILNERYRDTFAGEGSMIISSVVHWGEKIEGDWKFEVHDIGGCNSNLNSMHSKQRGFITYVGLEFWGTSIDGSGMTKNRKLLTNYLSSIGKTVSESGNAHQLTLEETGKIFHEQRTLSFDLSKSALKKCKKN